MPDTNVVRLPGHPVLAGQTAASPGQGGCLFAFGLPFVAVGVYAAWVVRFHPNQLSFSGPAMPFAFIYCLAGLFVVSGLVVWWRALRATFAGLLLQRRVRRHADAPWLADRAWNPKGDHEVVKGAVEHYRRRPSSSFSDCLFLEVARKAGHLPLGTFDKSVGRLSGTHRL